MTHKTYEKKIKLKTKKKQSPQPFGTV